MRVWMRVAGLAVVLALAGGVRADDKSSDKKLTDSHFVDHAYTAGQNEVIMNQMALQRSRNEDVRKFAQKMIEDHGKNNQELTLVVSELKIAVPDKPLPEQEKDLKHLGSPDVKDFDKEFMDHMVMDHEKAVKLFEHASNELKNDKLKDYAKKSLPTLKEHLKLAKEVRDKVGGRSGTERTGTAERPHEAGKSLTDNAFVTKAASSGKAEVAIGKLAQEKAKNADVKKLADRVVTDHTKANDELARLAKDAGISVSDKSDAAHDDKVKHFHSTADKDFDREFVNHMVDSHTKGVELFTQASKELKNEQLRNFAAKTLPTIKEHLDMAKRLQGQVGRQ